MRTRRALGGWSALLLAASFAGGCAPAPCEQRAYWRNSGVNACLNCQNEMCATERTSMSSTAVLGPCAPEYACATRCADASSGTCGCTEQCLATPACRTAWDALAACAARACSERCR